MDSFGDSCWHLVAEEQVIIGRFGDPGEDSRRSWGLQETLCKRGEAAGQCRGRGRPLEGRDAPELNVQKPPGTERAQDFPFIQLP